MVIVKVENDFERTVGNLFYNDDEEKTSLSSLVQDNWSVEIFWFPFNSLDWCQMLCPNPSNHLCNWDPKNDKLWIRKINIPQLGDAVLEPCVPQVDAKFDAAKDLAASTFGRLLSTHLNENQDDVPRFLWTGFKIVKRTNNSTTYEYINKAIHYQRFLEAFPVLDVEFAFNFDVDATTDQTKAMRNVVETVHNLATGKGYDSDAPNTRHEPQFPLSVAMEMRWMASSDALMCPARAASSKDKGGKGESTTTMINTVTITTTTKTRTKKENKKANVKPYSSNDIFKTSEFL